MWLQVTQGEMIANRIKKVKNFKIKEKYKWVHYESDLGITSLETKKKAVQVPKTCLQAIKMFVDEKW